MNYFGHAAVASFRSLEPRFVLGAMLPDLVPMAGVSVPRSLADEKLSRGVSFHLETDAVFHGARSFISWNRQALADLRALGVSRGPARACAHIGVEMLIDAELVARDEAFASYEAALRWLVDSPDALLPASTEDADRSRALCTHLLVRGRAAFEPSEERFAFRLGRALALRPRLCPSAHELLMIAKYLSGFDAPRRGLAALLTELQPLWAAPSAHIPSPVQAG